MIQEDYCSYELSQLLKEKGFKGVCEYAYSNKGNYFKVDRGNFDEVYCLRPTHQMACAWLRKNYNLHVCPKLVCFRGAKKYDKEYYKWEDRVLRLPTNNQVHPQFMVHEYYNTYEEAVEAALKYSLENLI